MVGGTLLFLVTNIFLFCWGSIFFFFVIDSKFFLAKNNFGGHQNFVIIHAVKADIAKMCTAVQLTNSFAFIHLFIRNSALVGPAALRTVSRDLTPGCILFAYFLMCSTRVHLGSLIYNNDI